MARSKSYKEDLNDSLNNLNEAVAYLNAALEDGDPEVFLLALRDVAEARGGGMTRLSEKTKLNRENLYKILSERGNPELVSLEAVLDALGLRLAVQPKSDSAEQRATI